MKKCSPYIFKKGSAFKCMNETNIRVYFWARCILNKLLFSTTLCRSVAVPLGMQTRSTPMFGILFREGLVHR